MSIRVLFVCHGNICRSPISEFVMKDMVAKRGIKAKFYIASAATSTEEIWNGIGNPVYPPAKRELAKHGISCEGKRAVQITKLAALNPTMRVGKQIMENMIIFWEWKRETFGISCEL